jgi:hypothetical protein
VRADDGDRCSPCVGDLHGHGCSQPSPRTIVSSTASAVRTPDGRTCWSPS